MKKQRIVICVSAGFPEAQVDALRKAAPQADIVVSADKADDIAKALPGATAMIGCPRHLWSDDLLRVAGNALEWIHASGAGCEEFITPGLVGSSVTLTNGRIIQGPEVADHAVALLLTLARNIHLALRPQPGPLARPIELRGKTAVVMGVGGIGMLIAERLHAFGMRVIGINPAMIPMVSFIETVLPPDRLAEALPEADAVLMAAPHTVLTRKVFDAAAFAAMKPSTYFVNVSRGKTVDTAALQAALQDGRIAAAGIDVTDPEPLPADHPLRSMPNVIVTAHQAGLSDHNRHRSFEVIRTNVERYGRGLPLLNIVDKALGY